MNGKRVRLKPIRREKENLRSFYFVNYQGEEYKVRMWNFQINQKGLPDFLDCIVTEFPNYVKISQSQATLIREIYEVGGTYFVPRERPSEIPIQRG